MATAENSGTFGVHVVDIVDGNVPGTSRRGSETEGTSHCRPTASRAVGQGSFADQSGYLGFMSLSVLPQSHHQTRWVPIPGSTIVTLLRHGASQGFTPGQPFPLVDGHGDPALAPSGHEQAILAGRRLAAQHQGAGEDWAARIEALYVTSLTRTHETAAPLAAALGLTPLVEADLREVFLGDWEAGLFRQKAAEAHPAALRAIEAGEWGEIPGAESSAQLTARVMGSLDRLADAHRNQRIVCVVHGGVIAAALNNITGSPSFLGAENASLSTIVHDGQRWRLRSFNDTAHLDGGWSA